MHAVGRCLALLLASWHASATLPERQDQLLGFARPGWYNPSLAVLPDGKVHCAIKDTNYTAVYVTFNGVRTYRTIWHNQLYLCSGKMANLHSLPCQLFNPWQTPYSECQFDVRVRGGRLDNTGLGDVKVWTWPGKGVYAIFGRKPKRNSKSPWCEGLIVYHQWVAQVAVDPQLSADDPWNLANRDPLPLMPDMSTHVYQTPPSFVMEKNWMPFLYTDPKGAQHVYVTYYVKPHMVCEIFPNGSTVHRWTTHNPKLTAKFDKVSVHGGPPVVLVPAELSFTGKAYYLGVMHFFEMYGEQNLRLYRHFLFSFQSKPPFAINGISDELPLVFNQTAKPSSKFVAFVSGLSMDASGVYITYGSADIQSRLLLLSMSAVEQLFSGKTKFIKHTDPSFDMGKTVVL